MIKAVVVSGWMMAGVSSSGAPSSKERETEVRNSDGIGQNQTVHPSRPFAADEKESTVAVGETNMLTDSRIQVWFVQFASMSEVFVTSPA